MARHPPLDPRNNGAVIASAEETEDQIAESLLGVVGALEDDSNMKALTEADLMTLTSRWKKYKPYQSRSGVYLSIGWYFIDDRHVLSAPYPTKLDCEHAIEAAKYVEAR